MAQRSDLSIQNLRGGMNNTDPPHSLPDNQAVLAENVEFFSSTLGERRRGMEAVDLTDSGLDEEDAVVHLDIYLPAFTELKNAQLFGIAATLDTSTAVAYRAGSVWFPVIPDDAISPVTAYVVKIQSVSIHGKWYVAYKSAVDRMHLWDGVSLRRTGIAAPAAAPTAMDTGGAGSFTGDRIYRVRFIKKDGDTILLRSEPSDELTFSPSGSNDGVVVTRPALVDEGETHWELEASDGDGNFYIIATTVIATTTATDTTQPSTDYATFVLSEEDIGDYELIPSVKFVIADQDRLIFGGSWEDETHGSRIAWTPVYAAPGVGNDERIPTDTDNFIDLDWMEGGDLTGLSAPVNGSFYAFKYGRIYKVQRTGNLDQAYEAFLLSATRGAIYGSIINGVDEYGRACVYFLDPQAGPARIGSGGLQFMTNLRQTWLHVNTNADTIISHGIYYPDLQQVHWWVAFDGSEIPAYKIISQTTEVQSQGDEAAFGWSVATGTITEAWCSAVVPEIVTDEEGVDHLSFRPYAGYASPYFVQRLDIGDTDAGNTYRARVLTKPYIVAGLLNWWGAMTAALLAPPAPDSATRVNVKFIRDFGLEENDVTTDLNQEASEDLVIKVFDNLRMSHTKVLQVEFSDPE